jgi:hypothetical protein
MRVLTAMWYRVWLYRKLHYIITLMQILIPPLILFIMALYNSSLFSKKTFVSKTTYYPVLKGQVQVLLLLGISGYGSCHNLNQLVDLFQDLFKTMKCLEKCDSIVMTTINNKSRVTYFLEGRSSRDRLKRVIEKLKPKLDNYGREGSNALDFKKISVIRSRISTLSSYSVSS